MIFGYIWPSQRGPRQDTKLSDIIASGFSSTGLVCLTVELQVMPLQECMGFCSLLYFIRFMISLQVQVPEWLNKLKLLSASLSATHKG